MNKFRLTAFFLIFLFGNFYVTAKSFQIKSVDYDIKGSSIPFSGKTNVYVLEKNVSPDFETVFSKEDFESYLHNYVQKLNNLRVFDEIQVSFSEIEAEKKDGEITFVKLQIKLVDSNHILGVPYPKYDSNVGINLKIKLKDMNFLGTLSPLSSDIYFIYPFDSENTSKELGTTLKYDYPFKMCEFDATWVNDYKFYYVFNSNSFEWNGKTGVNISIPLNQHSSKNLMFEFYQSSIRNYDYEIFNDSTFFNENLIISLPFLLHESDFFGKLIYKPYIDFKINWDMNGINPNNTSLSSPSLTFGHSLSTSQVNWNNNFRKGLMISLSNYFSYNFQRHIVYPYMSAEVSYFNHFNLWNFNLLNTLGISTRLWIFNYFINKDNRYFNSDGTSIGSRLRGIRDDLYYNNTSIKSGTTISAIIFNLDIPIRFFSTNFSQKLLQYFNFDLHFSPFIDFALTHNKITGKYFDLKDGFYAGGIEMLVYPKKWSSFTIRASIGIDFGRAFLKKHIHMNWREDSSLYEISFGIGLQY